MQDRVKPTVWTLLGVGSALFTAAAVAGLYYPLRTERFKIDGGVTTVQVNYLGQSLSTRISKWTSDDDGEISLTIDEGPFPNRQRHGKWKRLVHRNSRATEETEHWYMRDREVTREEWERR